MASESDDSDLRERVAELEATVEQQQATIKKMLPGRRGALKAGGLLAGGGLLGALGSDQAAAADGTQDTSAGTIGAAGDSNDIYLDQLYDPDGDEILNVDDTGDINAAFGRTWAFNDISVPNFSPDSIDTNSLTTDDGTVTNQWTVGSLNVSPNQLVDGEEGEITADGSNQPILETSGASGLVVIEIKDKDLSTTVTDILTIQNQGATVTIQHSEGSNPPPARNYNLNGVTLEVSISDSSNVYDFVSTVFGVIA